MARKSNGIVSVDELKKLFPRHSKSMTRLELEALQAAENDPEFEGYELINALLDNKDITDKFRCSFIQYINAVRFSAYTIGGSVSAVEAYTRVFSDRDFVKERKDKPYSSNEYKALTSAASNYSNSPLVRAVLEREASAVYLKYRGTFDEAMEVLKSEMHDANLSKDRIMAADRLAFHIKRPETLKIQAEVTHNGGPDLSEQVREQLELMMNNQQKMLSSGVDLREVQKIGINFEVQDAEIIDVEQ